MHEPLEWPAGCHPITDHWCLPPELSGIASYRMRFDPAQLDMADFPRHQIPVPAGVAKRKAEFLAGRFCARQALMQLGVLAETPAIGPDRAPCWPEGICGAITHGHQHAMAIAAHRHQWQALGVDLEHWLPVERALKLAPELLTPAELERCQSLPEAEQARRILLSFSFKESLFKALYPLTGQRFYFQEAEVLPPTESAGQARLRLCKDLNSDWKLGHELLGHYWAFEDSLLTLIALPNL